MTELELKLSAVIEDCKEDVEQHARHVTFLIQENNRLTQGLKDVTESDNPYDVAWAALNYSEDVAESVITLDLADVPEIHRAIAEDTNIAYCSNAECVFSVTTGLEVGEPCPKCGKPLIACPF